MTTRSVAAALDRIFEWIGVPSRDDTWSTLWRLNQAWTYELTNDWVFDLDPEPAKVCAVVASLRSDPEQGISELLELAAGGSARAMLWAAWCYWSGEGVAADPVQAETWYLRSAQAGSLRGLLDYCALLHSRRDYAEAEKAIARHAPADWGPGQFWRAWYRLKLSDDRRTLAEVRPLFEYAAEHGSPMAGVILWRAMTKGRLGFREIPRGVRMMMSWVKTTYPKIEDARAAVRP